MSTEDNFACEVCGDELCPGCEEFETKSQFLRGFSVLIVIGVVYLSIGQVFRSNSSESQNSQSETEVTRPESQSTVNLPKTTNEQPVVDTSPISSTTVTAAPVIEPVILGPFDHPLLKERPAAIWFWKPGCSLCETQAEFISRVLKVWAQEINIVSIALGDDYAGESEFKERYQIDIPEIDDPYGELTSIFEIGQTSDWGFILPDGSHKTVASLLTEKSLNQEFVSLSRSRPMSIIDTSVESEVRAAFVREFSQKPPPLKWTGSVRGCDPGSTSALNREATLSRVNWFRAMAGVSPEVVLDEKFNSLAQAAALTMYASGRLDHEPDSSFRCISNMAAEGAIRSNLHLGYNGPDAIDGYMEDEGANNGSVGHRRWILLPELSVIGTGDTKGSNALLVVSDFKHESIKIRDRGIVAWPPRGFVPRKTIYRRWSISAETAFRDGAHVLVQTSKRKLFDGFVDADDKVGWETLVFSISPSLIGKDPIFVKVSEMLSDGRQGSVITSYQIFPFD